MFKPLLAGASLPDRLLACIGSIAGIGLTIVICRLLLFPVSDMTIIVAPIGASAVLVFAVPSSPLAQPWPVIGGNTISALVGTAAFHLVPDATIAAAVAVGGAILAMSLLRCLHPPGGAAALTAVIGSESIHAAGYGFALAPVCLNSIALVGIAMLYHRTGAHSYPHKPAISAEQERAPIFLPADIDAALEDMHESFDIDRADIAALMENVERHALARSAGSKPGPSPR